MIYDRKGCGFSIGFLLHSLYIPTFHLVLCIEQMFSLDWSGAVSWGLASHLVMNDAGEWFRMLSPTCVTLGLLTRCPLCRWGEGVPALSPRAGPASGADAAPGRCGAVYGH